MPVRQCFPKINWEFFSYSFIYYTMLYYTMSSVLILNILINWFLRALASPFTCNLPNSILAQVYYLNAPRISSFLLQVIKNPKFFNLLLFLNFRISLISTLFFKIILTMRDLLIIQYFQWYFHEFNLCK